MGLVDLLLFSVFLFRMEKEEADVVDSDFDIDENEEAPSDEGGEDEDGKRKRSRRLVTRAYKEPIKAPTSPKRKSKGKAPAADRKRKYSSSSDNAASTSRKKAKIEVKEEEDDEEERDDETDSEEEEEEPKGQKSGLRNRDARDAPKYEPIPYEPASPVKRSPGRPPGSIKLVPKKPGLSSPARKAMRSSTKMKSMQTIARVKEREKVQAKRRKYLQSRRVVEEMPTQEELLEEAKITEVINLESLGK